MTLRPGRPVIPVNQCQFERCRSTRAKLVNIDGQHPRNLCDQHANGVHEVWTRLRHAYRVSWGISSAERAAKDEARLAVLLAEYGEPQSAERPEEPPFEDTDEWWDRIEQEAEPASEPTDQERAWEEIDNLRFRIDDIALSRPRAAVVRVTPITEDEPRQQPPRW